MIYSLTGVVAHTEIGLAVIECAGVGYGVRTSLSTLSALPPIGEKAKIYTYMNVREDAVELFGFADKEELNCFKMLVSVSGVGPKAAISILSDLTPQKFALCVATGDAKTLTKCQGIGLKTASRIVLELKDKIAKQQLTSSSDIYKDIPQLQNNNALSEAINALVVLGYSQSEATVALSTGAPEDTVEELIKLGLKQLAKKF